ncbi:hypothetical protein EON63_01780, partial [archaeon]
MFDILRKTLQVNDRNPDLLENLEACTHDLALSSLQQISHNSEDELQKLKLKRQNLENQFKRASAFFETSAQEISSRRETALHKIQTHQQVVKQRLHNQQTTAERRLEELCLEMIGEYAKCLLRGRKREKALGMKDTEDRVFQTFLLTWRRFALRLQHDLCIQPSPSTNSSSSIITNRLIVQVLDPALDSVQTEVNKLLGKVVKKKITLFSDEDLYVHAAIRITPSKPPSGACKANSNTSLLFSYASNYSEFEQLLEHMRDWGARFNNNHTTPSKSNGTSASSPVRSSRGGSRLGHTTSPTSSHTNHTHTHTHTHRASTSTCKSSDLIHTACIEYTHPPSQVPHDVWEGILLHHHSHHNTQAIPSPSTSSPIPSSPYPYPSFLDTYVARFGSSLSSPLVYVCLEERALRKTMMGGSTMSKR